MSYVDGFVVPVLKANIETYKAIAEKASAIWMEHGALSYRECLAEDTAEHEFCRSFAKAFGPKDDEVLFFSYIEYACRADRDAINAKVMADERLQSHDCEGVFDVKRMAYGGFETVVKG